MLGKSMLAIVALVLFSSCMSNNTPLVIGHRGAMGHETENTLASIQKAIDLGADMIEIDVFVIKSGEIAVFHDDEVDRLTDGTGKIEAYDWEGLQQLNLEGGHKIPSLQQVLDVIDNKVILNIELKGANTAEPTNRVIQEYCTSKEWDLDSFVISSFKWDELKTMRSVDPKIPIAILIGKNPLEAISIGKEINAVAINPAYKALTEGIVVEMQAEGFKVYPWTVNEAEDIALMKSFGVDGIITNFPERVH
ncbi:glycerophosphodiester phosphodiesterase family protein [uncultured Kriegella sp.]|uniref:glycerophosphodiester phosphodiesterase n=1 Tax=uncultured Kriegella sp. TaxID=1798910 RepID=UPI0030DA8B04|tara:strand:+ start:102059 stop:102808 length:750 start_codon:yes stop_codon:yes gene_type:complete